MTKSTKQKLQRFLVGYSRFLGTAAIIGVILLLIPLSVPCLFGYQTYDVVSGSMEPEIPVGSMIFVKEIVPEDVVEGDIIAFYSNSNVVCHRVTYNNIYERKLNTKGDANPDEDLNDTTYDKTIDCTLHGKELDDSIIVEPSASDNIYHCYIVIEYDYEHCVYFLDKNRLGKTYYLDRDFGFHFSGIQHKES